jgi:hypothetical protein
VTYELGANLLIVAKQFLPDELVYISIHICLYFTVNNDYTQWAFPDFMTKYIIYQRPQEDPYSIFSMKSKCGTWYFVVKGSKSPIGIIWKHCLDLFFTSYTPHNYTTANVATFRKDLKKGFRDFRSNLMDDTTTISPGRTRAVIMLK